MKNLFNFKSGSIFVWALRGAGLSFVALLLFVTTLLIFGNVLNDKSLWENIWQIFPLFTGTIGGAIGGLIFGLSHQIWQPNGWKKLLYFGFGIIIYLAIIWMSLILGFSVIGQWD